MDSYRACKWKPKKVSAKRDFPKNQSTLSDHGVSQLHKKHKFHDESEEDMFDCDFIPLEADFVSTDKCNSDTPGSDYDIIPRIISTENRFEEELKEKKNSWLNYRICSDDEADDVDDNSEEEIAKLSPYIELRLNGVCLKEIRCYQTRNELKIKLSVDNLHKLDSIVDVESLGEESITRESVINRVTNERFKTYEQIRSRRPIVSAVRCYPPGCGPDAALLSDEDLKKAIDESKTHMLICKSCVMRG